MKMTGMKRWMVAGAVLLFSMLSSGGARAADAPRSLGGFVLGEPISRYGDRLEMDTVIRVRDVGCLMEVDVIPPAGFENGTINYGVCAARDRIVRIKLKYADESRGFYEELLSRYKARFGPPDEWKGDPFHVVIAWKWYFKDRNNDRISLILQHNTQDEDEKIGNSVKLTHSTAMAAEIRHYRERRTREKPPVEKERSVPDWDRLLPR
ncbi:hypothetical protein B2D07_17360 [Desulfococcus multivorans]|jgi:hypothetical protein|nr:hypothetical protein B2D07_17360 [Desulfococcus multivorans]